MLNAALDGSLNQAEFIIDERFGIEVPTTCPNVPAEVLIPRNTWAQPDRYDLMADKLARMFNNNFTRYSKGVSDEVNAAEPQVLN